MPNQIHLFKCQNLRTLFVEFPQFSKQVVSNLLMLNSNFESLDEALIPLRSLLLAFGGTGGEGLLAKFL